MSTQPICQCELRELTAMMARLDDAGLLDECLGDSVESGDVKQAILLTNDGHEMVAAGADQPSAGVGDLKEIGR